MAKARIKKGSGAAVALTRRRLMLASGLSGLAVALVVGALVFQDNIARFRLNPRTPFQIEAPPPAPNYQARDTWLLWPDVAPADARAEIFYLHSTAYYSNAGWNAPIGDVSAGLYLSFGILAALLEHAAMLQVGKREHDHARRCLDLANHTLQLARGQAVVIRADVRVGNLRDDHGVVDIAVVAPSGKPLHSTGADAITLKNDRSERASDLPCPGLGDGPPIADDTAAHFPS